MLKAPRYNLLSPACGDGPLNIFFAGAGFDYDLPYDMGVRKRLLSWHANSADDIQQFIDAQANGRESFGIVDSGAFTVWNKGGVINVEDYINKLIELLPYFDVAANLDVIPGKKGMAASEYTPAITHAAAEEGWKNYIRITHSLEEIEIDGTGRVMPIYHQGEHMDWLRKMVDHGCPYIGISPSNDYATSQRMHWLDDVFDYLRSLPKIPKTHGYAVTSPRLMVQYPWMSVDSASWVQQGGYGTVSTPFGTITLTDRKDVMGRADAMDGAKWNKEMREKLSQYFTSIGLDMDDVRNGHHGRWKANAAYMLNLEKKMVFKPRPKAVGLFDTPPKAAPAPHPQEPKERQDAWGLSLDGKPLKGEVPMSLFDGRKVDS